ncbi:L-dopachrome tautomerase-related protein [Spirosoma aerolatum]|uniref:L-dopachrome tautomerase-related protein n=1 Tax=Spirosoma aerolatum TaxID=1211326 RepID=UPI0009ACC6EE|nr:L-dopachrome tautomerase-related protein [Spirosoma aerolatum]
MKTLSVTLFFLLSSFIASAQSHPSTKLETVAQFGRHQPIGLGVSQDNRIFVTFPKNPINYDYGLAEIVHGKRIPYPNAEWNQWDSLNPQHRFINVQALFVDQTNDLWVLDPASPSGQKAIPEGIKLLKINLKTNQVERVYRFEDLPRERTGLNDVQIDTRRQKAYLSDPGRGAIVVLDLRSGKSRTVLDTAPSTKADPDFVLTIDGKEVRDSRGNPFRSNVNGIALTHDFKYLYFRPITQTKLYRITVDDLVNLNLSPAELSGRVESMGETGVSHGMIADKAGRIYLTDSPDKAIRYVTPGESTAERRLRVLVQDNRLLWPDSFGIGTDGYLYVTAAQIHRTRRYNNGEDNVVYPFGLYRVKLPE